mmetsp:Transcript_14490/g.41496  ORF Transcript_14490/g.41496 Transcript_14490/m.41496 type:complete len:212 (-) Transcript_14490:104-739(-)
MTENKQLRRSDLLAEAPSVHLSVPFPMISVEECDARPVCSAIRRTAMQLPLQLRLSPLRLSVKQLPVVRDDREDDPEHECGCNVADRLTEGLVGERAVRGQLQNRRHAGHDSAHDRSVRHRHHLEVPDEHVACLHGRHKDCRLPAPKLLATHQCEYNRRSFVRDPKDQGRRLLGTTEKIWKAHEEEHWPMIDYGVQNHVKNRAKHQCASDA